MITILTFANKNTPGLINFKNSFAKFPDWNLQIIGMGQEWKGWITRMSAYRDYAQQCDSETLLVCLDGYDVLCLRNSDQFYEDFKKFNRKYVFGAELDCSKKTCKRPKNWQRENKIQNFHVNGGCVIAKAKDIYFLYNWCIQKGHTKDDQISLGYFMDNFPTQVSLDTNRNIIVIHEMLFRTDPKIKNNKLFLNGFSKLPYFIHYPAIMSATSIPLLQIRPPKSYSKIASFLLGDQALLDLEINKKVYKKSSWIIISFLMLLVILIIIFVILYLKCRQKKSS
jgi:hypothetical protein